MSAITRDQGSVLVNLRQTAARLVADLDGMLGHPGDAPSLPLRLALAHALALSDQLTELVTGGEPVTARWSECDR